MPHTKKPTVGAVKFQGHMQSRLTAEPVMRILCKRTDALVGYLYKWNNGDLQPAWLSDTVASVRYEPMSEAA